MDSNRWRITNSTWLSVFGYRTLLHSIGIPFGLQNIKIGIFTLIPFGKEASPLPEHSSTLYFVLNIIYS